VERLWPYAWVALGGALGSVARVWLSALVFRFAGPSFPWGTLLINVAGSALIGWFAMRTGPAGALDVSENMRVFVIAGLCGGFTTFSAFSLQTLELLQAGALARAASYVLGSVALCLLGVWLGAMLGRA
jgi:CrcB protein